MMEAAASEPVLLTDLSDEEALAQLGLYLTNISKALNAPALVKTARQDGVVVFHLETQKQGILIGKHGKTECTAIFGASVYSPHREKQIVDRSECRRLP